MYCTTKQRKKQIVRWGRSWGLGLVGVVLVGQWVWGAPGADWREGVQGPPPRVVLEVPGPVRRPRRRRGGWERMDWRAVGASLWEGLPWVVGRSSVDRKSVV